MKEFEQQASAADRIKEAMRDARLKQLDLAKATGLSHSTISRYMNGQMEPKQKAINKLAIALDVSEMWLWGYDVPKTRTPEQKKNDSLAETIVKMRRHPDLTETIYKVVSLYEQSPEKFASIDQILSGLVNK